VGQFCCSATEQRTLIYDLNTTRGTVARSCLKNIAQPFYTLKVLKKQQTVYSNKTASSLLAKTLMSFSGYLAFKTDKISFTCCFANNVQEFANLNALNERNIPNLGPL